jgi:hypothetical protein
MLSCLKPWGVSGVGDIKNHGHMRLKAMSNHAGAVVADLLLDRIGRDSGGVRAGGVPCKRREDFSQEKAADSVVDGATNETSG